MPAHLRPCAVVSVDLDPVDRHLVGYGHEDAPADDLVYRTALPRLLDAFARASVRATLFIVARDAAAQAPLLRRAVAEGHEIACHTWSHPLRLASLPRPRLEHELGESRRALERAAGHDVIGFRAPNFDMDTPTLAHLAELGYRYDASVYPSPLLTAARLVLALKSARPADVLAMRPWPLTWQRHPHVRSAGGRRIAEFPLTVTPVLRMPIYHTLRYYGAPASFERRLQAVADRGELLSYVLHGVDALGLVEDSVDARLAGHPGMRWPLARKLELLDATLATIGSRFGFRPYREVLPVESRARGGE